MSITYTGRVPEMLLKRLFAREGYNVQGSLTVRAARIGKCDAMMADKTDLQWQPPA